MEQTLNKSLLIQITKAYFHIWKHNHLRIPFIVKDPYSLISALLISKEGKWYGTCNGILENKSAYKSTFCKHFQP